MGHGHHRSRGLRSTAAVVFLGLVAGLLVAVVRVAVEEPSQADAVRAATAPFPNCVVDESGNEGLGCAPEAVGSVTSGNFTAGGRFTVLSSPDGLAPCLTYVSTGCYYSLSAPSILRCVYLHDDDPDDVRPCSGSFSREGPLYTSSAQRQGSCSGALGSTYVYGGDARYPSTWWVSRAAKLAKCEYVVPGGRPIDNLSGPTFLLVRTSARECIEPGNGYGCDESWATLETRNDYGWLPVDGDLRPGLPKASCRVIAQSGIGGSEITFEDTSEVSGPDQSGLATEFERPDGTTNAAGIVSVTADEPGTYTMKITAEINGRESVATCSADVDPAELQGSLRLVHDDPENDTGRFAKDEEFDVVLRVKADDGVGAIDATFDVADLFVAAPGVQIVGAPEPAVPATASLEVGEWHEYTWRVAAESFGRFRVSTTVTGEIDGTAVRPLELEANGRVAGEIDMTLELEPNPVEVPLDEAGAPEPQTVTATVTMTNTTEDPIEEIEVDGDLTTALVAGDTLAMTQTTGPATNAEGRVEIGTLGGSESTTLTWELEVDGGGEFRARSFATWSDPSGGTAAGIADDTVEVEVDSALEVELNGAVTNSVDIIEVVADIQNDGDSEIEDIDWGAGLAKDVLVGDDTPTRLASGPIPPLPTTLAPGQSTTVRWTFFVEHAGVEVMTLEASGDIVVGNANVEEELSVEISERLIEAIDHQRQAALGLEEMLRNASGDLRQRWDDSVAEAKAAAGQTDDFYRKNYDAYRRLGFSDTTASFLANGEVQREFVSRYFDSYVTAAENRIDELGAEGGEAIYRNGSKVWSFLTDAEVRRQTATQVIEWGVRETGYLADGIADPNRPGVLETSRTSWDAVWTEVDSSIEFAADGQLDIWRLEAGEFSSDPLGFAEKMGGRHGDQGATVAWYTAAGVVEEVATGGLGPVTSIGRGVENGIDGLRTTSRLENGTDAPDLASDAFTDAQRRFAEAEKRAQTVHQSPYGQQISPESLERYGGFNADDADAIMSIVDDVKRDFGVDIEIAFRTAEPMSVGIDGIGKRAFTKEKAVGAMDLLIGAPPSAAGKVTVFRPTPLPESTLRAIEADNPGFRARYSERLQTQQKNWDAWSRGEGKLYELVEASRAHPDGINILDGVPGQETYGVRYLEQLDDPAFLAANPQITDEVVQQLRSDPNVTFAKLDVDPVGNGFTFSDHVRTVGNGGEVTLTKKPIISDYDGQAVVPVDGAWPAGTRGQIETLVKQRLDQIGRHGRHGWSGTANDLPSDLFHLPVEYAMSTAHPSVAMDMAQDFSRRFKSLAGDFRAKASRIESGLDGLSTVDRRAAEAQIARLRATADKYDTYTPEKILEEWPPSEKTIVFSKGRVSVGSNGGT